tara:strand:- start:22 stop:285 length:264 start_codon:yes stop_codon:yes gene_type:complete
LWALWRFWLQCLGLVVLTKEMVTNMFGSFDMNIQADEFENWAEFNDFLDSQNTGDIPNLTELDFGDDVLVLEPLSDNESEIDDTTAN